MEFSENFGTLLKYLFGHTDIQLISHRKSEKVWTFQGCNGVFADAGEKVGVTESGTPL